MKLLPMKKSILISLLLSLLMTAFVPFAVYAGEAPDASEPHLQIVYDGDVMTYYFDAEDHTEEGSVYGPDSIENKMLAAKIVLDESMLDYHPTNLSNFFYGYSAVTAIEGLEYLDTSQATNMSGMFSSCKYLTHVDLSGFHTENVTDMSSMFSGCEYLYYVDLSSCSAEKLLKATSMFYNCKKLTAVVLPKTVNSKFQTLDQAFVNCPSLETIYSDKNWPYDSGVITVYSTIFDGCSKLVGGNGTAFATYSVSDSNGKGYRYTRLDGYEKGYFTQYTEPLPERNKLSEATVTLEDTVFKATKFSLSGMTDPIEPSVTVECGGKTLIAGTDYTIEYANNDKTGRANVIITGLGEYEGLASASFRIMLNADLLKDSIMLEQDEYIYDGTEKTPKVYINYMAEGTAYTVSYSDNTQPGTAHVTVTGIGEFLGSATVDFSIIRELEKEAVLTKNSCVYGEDLPTVEIPGLTEGTDFTCEYPDDAERLGEHTIVIRGAGDYAGTADFARVYYVFPADVRYEITYTKGTEGLVTDLPQTGYVRRGGPEYTVSSAAPQREGYEFLGWELDYAPRSRVSYTVEYRDVNSGRMLCEPIVGSGQIGEPVTLSARDLEGYELCSAQNVQMTLQADEMNNIQIFWYKESPRTVITEYTVKYTGLDLWNPILPPFSLGSVTEEAEVGKIIKITPPPTLSFNNSAYNVAGTVSYGTDGLTYYMKLDVDPQKNIKEYLYFKLQPSR